jgi:hypothetical protein
MNAVVIAALVLASMVAGAGCATLGGVFDGADTPQEKLSRVMDGVSAAVQGVGMVAKLAGADIATSAELAEIDAALAETKTGLVHLTGVVEGIVARYDAEHSEDAAAISADAAALP